LELKTSVSSINMSIYRSSADNYAAIEGIISSNLPIASADFILRSKSTDSKKHILGLSKHRSKAYP